MTNIKTILEKFDYDFRATLEFLEIEGEQEEVAKLKSFLHSSLTELLADICEEMEREKLTGAATNLPVRVRAINDCLEVIRKRL